MTRYASMFERCAAQERGAIVPFVMLGDPTPSSCEAIIEALIADGADALEIGIPFSDPVADGVVIQEVLPDPYSHSQLAPRSPHWSAGLRECSLLHRG